MAHYPKPFFRPARGLWYVQINGKQINLGPDQEAAFTAYHGLMQQRSEEQPPTASQTPAARPLVVVIIDDFLDWCEKNRAPDSYQWYKARLNSFCKTIDASLTTEQLKPHHVQKWVDSGDPFHVGLQVASRAKHAGPVGLIDIKGSRLLILQEGGTHWALGVSETMSVERPRLRPARAGAVAARRANAMTAS